MNILLGNIVSLIGCTVMVLIGFIKNKDRYIVMQTLQFGLNALSHFLLGGYGGTVASLVSVVRNIIISRWKCTTKIKIALIALQAVFTISTITANPITWIPIIAAGMFTWYIDTKDVMWFKWVIIITLVMWAVYDIYHHNYVSVWFSAFTCITNGISMVKIHKERKEAKEKLPA
ncbi:MAG: YgjV family protein [Oscillospiraceae bacterium]|nr:YgjV family protein [Oscillospiraceae bacterium]